MNRFIRHLQVVTINYYNTLKITVTITNNACWAVVAGNESYLVNTSSTELPSEFSYE
jgi:hypothetical protein